MLCREERSPGEWNRNTCRYKRSKLPRRGRTSRPDIAGWDATGAWGFAWGPISATRSINAQVHFVHFICRAPQPKNALSRRALPRFLLKPAFRTPYPPDAGPLINPADARRFRVKAKFFADRSHGGRCGGGQKACLPWVAISLRSRAGGEGSRSAQGGGLAFGAHEPRGCER